MCVCVCVCWIAVHKILNPSISNFSKQLHTQLNCFGLSLHLSKTHKHTHLWYTHNSILKLLLFLFLYSAQLSPNYPSILRIFPPYDFHPTVDRFIGDVWGVYCECLHVYGDQINHSLHYIYVSIWSGLLLTLQLQPHIQTHTRTHTDLWHFVIIGWFRLIIRLRVTEEARIMWSMAQLFLSHTTKTWKCNRLEFRSVKILLSPWDNHLSISDPNKEITFILVTEVT